MSYVIGTGYFSRPGCGAEAFFRIWWENTMKHAAPKRVLVTACGGCQLVGADGQWIKLDGDLGHVGQILSGEKKYPYPSGAVEICTMALLAYLDECDFIYKEQDLLAFGPWVDRLYGEIGQHGIIFGQQKCMPSAPSLMLIKHWFIPEYVRWYLSTEPETSDGHLSEHKHARLQIELPEVVCYHTMGCDRDRPIPVGDEAFYCQKLTPEELQMLSGNGFIQSPIIPEDVRCFTNDIPNDAGERREN